MRALRTAVCLAALIVPSRASAQAARIDTMPLLPSLPALSERWAELPLGDDGERYVVDTTRLTRLAPTTVSAWVRHDYVRREYAPDMWDLGVVHTITHYHYDCTAKRLRIPAQLGYNRAGEVLQSFDRPPKDTTWSDVVPESVGEQRLEAVCRLWRRSR